MDRLLLAIAIVAGLAVAPARAAQDDPRLDKLFETLKTTRSDKDASAAEREIWRIWAENKNPEIERLMRHGTAAMESGDEQGALDAFDAVTRYDKGFAEGWNKRATVEAALGQYPASIADIERTLALEPRHFGALSGLGQIYLALGRKALALKAFRAALAIDPHLLTIRHAAEQIDKDLQGTPL
ncbi:MAG TPA: tetratricopeptide repeat protein [Stellaceae bacterium]|nr:tetratricopeptide repeat protein [Stellaceae bacterium]